MVLVRVKSYKKRINGKVVNVKSHTRNVTRSKKARQKRYAKRFGTSLEKDKVQDIMQSLRLDEGVIVKQIKRIKRSPYQLYRIVGINKRTKQMEEWFLVPSEDDLEDMAKDVLERNWGDYAEAGWVDSRDTIQSAFNRLQAREIISPPFTGDFNVTDRYDMKFWRVG